MRVTGGLLSGRPIQAPDGHTTRPTSDRVREALFNILAHHDFGRDVLTDATVLDAFGGSGALAIESLSRGADTAVLFETDRSAIKTISKNLTTLNLTAKARLMSCDATRPPAADQACALLFLDPPYKKGLIEQSYASLKEKGWVAQDALIIAETAKNEKIDWPESTEILFSRDYGDTSLHFLKEIS